MLFSVVIQCGNKKVFKNVLELEILCFENFTGKLYNWHKKWLCYWNAKEPCLLFNGCIFASNGWSA